MPFECILDNYSNSEMLDTGIGVMVQLLKERYKATDTVCNVQTSTDICLPCFEQYNKQTAYLFY